MPLLFSMLQRRYGATLILHVLWRLRMSSLWRLQQRNLRDHAGSVAPLRPFSGHSLRAWSEYVYEIGGMCEAFAMNKDSE